MSGKFALIIGNSRYNDDSLGRLKAPDIDVHELAERAQVSRRRTFRRGGHPPEPGLRVGPQGHRPLLPPASGATNCCCSTSPAMACSTIRASFDLAVHDTESGQLPQFDGGRGRQLHKRASWTRASPTARSSSSTAATAAPSAVAPRGRQAGVSVGTAEAFEGTGLGRVVLTATDSTQYAWEGDQIIGDAQTSLFTHFLIEGLKTGAADRDDDGDVTVDELYDYVREQVVTTTPRQTPHKWSYRQHGDIVLAQNPFAKRSVLPAEIEEAISSTLSGLRLEAVGHLESLLHGRRRRAGACGAGGVEGSFARRQPQGGESRGAGGQNARRGNAPGPPIRESTRAAAAADTRDPARPSDIFISYAHEDHEKARALANVLAARGWKVWWDRKIAPGEAYDVVIERELGTCKCAIVLWSARSVHATWVRNEARRAARRQVLLPILIDAVEMPLEFENLHAADLTSWSETGEHPGLETVIDRILALSPVPNEALARNVVEQARREVKAGRLETAVAAPGTVSSTTLSRQPRARRATRPKASVSNATVRRRLRREAEAARVEQERAETARREAEAARNERERVEAERREVEAARIERERVGGRAP